MPFIVAKCSDCPSKGVYGVGIAWGHKKFVRACRVALMAAVALRTGVERCGAIVVRKAKIIVDAMEAAAPQQSVQAPVQHQPVQSSGVRQHAASPHRFAPVQSSPDRQTPDSLAGQWIWWPSSFGVPHEGTTLLTSNTRVPAPRPRSRTANANAVNTATNRRHRVPTPSRSRSRRRRLRHG